MFIRHAAYYACWLPKRKRTRLGIEAENGLPETSGGVSTPVHINGQYVVWAIEGVAEGGEEAVVSALNARTGRIVRELEVPQLEEPDLVSSVSDVGVGADGSLVYLQLEGSPCPGNHTHGEEHSRDQGLVAFEPGDSPPRARLRSRQRPRILDHAPACGRTDGELDPRGGPSLGHASLAAMSVSTTTG